MLTIVSTVVAVARGVRSASQSSPLTLTRVTTDAFTAGPVATGIGGLAPPGDGLSVWSAAGWLADQRTGHRSPAVWSSTDGRAWQQTLLDEAGASSAEASAVARRNGTTVVVGARQTAASDSDAAAWVSRDGSTWAAVTLPAERGDQEMTSVGAGPVGFVAAGVDKRSRMPVPAVWYSKDGSSWQRVAAGSGGPFREGQAVHALAVGERQAVLVGETAGISSPDAGFWVSDDGSSWRRVATGGLGFTGPGDQIVRGVTATADGFVAVGADTQGTGVQAATVWTSSDGSDWVRRPPSDQMTQSEHQANSGGITANAVAGRGPVVAAGGRFTQVWASADGRQWTRENLPRSLVEDPGAVGPLATDGSRVVLATVDIPRPHLWLRDGGTWTEVDGSAFASTIDSLSPRAIATAGHTLLALGADFDETKPEDARTSTTIWRSTDGRVWTRLPDTTQAFGKAKVEAVTTWPGGFAAVGTVEDTPGHGVAAAWTSRDGTSWERAPRDQPAFDLADGTDAISVTAGGPGLVAVGFSYLIGQGLHAHAWTSADGVTWRVANDPPEWSGQGENVVSGVCTLRSGRLLAVGYKRPTDEQDGWAWVSKDGDTWERAPDDAALGGAGLQFPHECTSTTGGAVAAGNEIVGNLHHSRVWTSPDGLHWRRGGHQPFDDDDNYLEAVAAEGQRIVATGVAGGHLLVAASLDGGATWRRATLPHTPFGFQRGDAVSIEGDRVTVLAEDDDVGTVWTGRLPAA